MWFVYILYSETKDKYYTGYTHNLETRLNMHNSGATISTKSGIHFLIVNF
ncbi:MAG: GIY-YIG nuclease family protein [Ignavibacteria bacterium]|nr:GIY-YIG nuclease family protein [Ignavibacteria bacterium]